MHCSLFLFYRFLFLFDSELLIRYGGLLIILLIVFGSTGLFFCFFLPTGAVLFSAGVLIASGILPQHIFSVCSLLILAAVLGNLSGFWFGRKTGPSLYRRKDSKYFKKKYLVTAKLFYKKYGWLALTVGLFLPIIRTFSPIVAGMIKMKFKRFILSVVPGSVIWILSFVLAGYFMGSLHYLKPWLNYIVAGFILLVTVPITFKIIREMKKPGNRSDI